MYMTCDWRLYPSSYVEDVYSMLNSLSVIVQYSFSETLFPCMFSNSYRLSPSVPFTSRTLDKDIVLGDYAIPKGVSGLGYSYLTSEITFVMLIYILLLTEWGINQVS